MRQLPLLAVLTLAAAAALADEPVVEPVDHLIEFSVTDQFDAEHTQAEFAGKVMVLFWGDREGSQHIERWEKTVRRKLARELAEGTVEVRTVAHVQGAPGLIKGLIKDRFSREADGWVLMDWDGVFAAAYAPTEKHCNLLVFGPDGARLYQQASNRLTQDVLDGVLMAVNQGLHGDAPGATSTPTAAGVD